MIAIHKCTHTYEKCVNVIVEYIMQYAYYSVLTAKAANSNRLIQMGNK